MRSSHRDLTTNSTTSSSQLRIRSPAPEASAHAPTAMMNAGVDRVSHEPVDAIGAELTHLTRDRRRGRRRPQSQDRHGCKSQRSEREHRRGELVPTRASSTTEVRPARQRRR